MSWGTCYSGSNNIHFGTFPIMTDGRNYTSWQPSASVNQNIQQTENINSNFKYRQYLTNNAESIIKTNQMQACDECCGCPARYGNNQPNTGTPYLYKSCTDPTQPFGYNNSDLKKEYLSREELNSRMFAPKLSQYQYIQEHLPNSN
jgi:hypothetical protein